MLTAYDSILFRTSLQCALDRSTSPGAAFRQLQDLCAKLADDLPPQYDNAANLILAFALLVSPRSALTILETFTDLVDGLPAEVNMEVELARVSV
jgi:hypothetical protein